MTYFDNLKNLGFTQDRDLASPKDIAEARYRPVGSAEIQRCFGCHTTASDIDGKFDEAHLITGVTCEACHGPGAKHVAAMNSPSVTPNARNAAIFNSAHLNPVDAVELCGACHSSWWDVKLAGVKGVSTTRSAHIVWLRASAGARAMRVLNARPATILMCNCRRNLLPMTMRA